MPILIWTSALGRPSDAEPQVEIAFVGDALERGGALARGAAIGLVEARGGARRVERGPQPTADMVGIGMAGAPRERLGGVEFALEPLEPALARGQRILG